jgi:hypothetical protein
MIPPDVASSLRSVLTESQNATQQPQQTQPVAAIQRIADVLGNLVPGQRIMAEIQGMQANGTYRATVGQREITLSLPFSAKAGDSLELEVTESDGKLALAFVANRGEPAAKGQPVSVATSLSNTGRMIGDLLQELTVDGKRAPAAPLNGNQALVQSMPKDAAQLVPVLKQALTQSGMFYEAHQARWASGRLPTEQLRQEPQGRLPAPANPQNQGSSPAPTASPPQPAGGPSPAAPGLPGGAAMNSANPLPGSGGAAPSTTGSSAPAVSGTPTPTAPPTASANPANQAQPSLPPDRPQSSPTPPQQAQALAGQAATPPEAPSSAATSPQTSTAAPSTPANPGSSSVPANSAAPTAPNQAPATQAPANQAPATQATPAQAAPVQTAAAQAASPASGTPSLAANAAGPSQTASASPGTSLPENARATPAPLPPPLIRQGNLTYEAFPPRNAWLSQGAETQMPATASSAPLTQPAPPPANAQRAEAGQPSLPSPAASPRDEAAPVKTGSNPASPAEISRDTGGRTPIISTAGTEKAQAASPPAGPAGIPRDIAPLVQQQLDGLANQNYAWQGQIWPGQNLWWEIGEDPESRRGEGEEDKRWQTRLKLTLPVLGDVDARISLQGSGQISLRLAAGDAASATQLQERLAELRQQFETAGLSIGQMRVDHEPHPEAESAA